MTEEDPNPHPIRKVPRGNRTRPAQNRIYQHLGVRDLREIIDRKRNERGYHEAGVATLDSSYNYSKHDFRESVEQSQEPKLHKYKNKPNTNFKRDKEQFAGHSSNQAKLKDIENPVNIRVEFSTSTGQHTYKLDEITVLPTIKHIPDHAQSHRTFRSRGRGRGRDSRSYQTRTIRNNKRFSNDRTNNVDDNGEAFGHVSFISSENWDDDLNETKVVREPNKLPDQNFKELKEYDEYDENHENESFVDENYETDGLEKDIENLKLNEEDNSIKKDDVKKGVTNT